MRQTLLRLEQESEQQEREEEAEAEAHRRRMRMIRERFIAQEQAIEEEENRILADLINGMGNNSQSGNNPSA
eukprot:CAMPEP_0172441484 /NCGR_PEP_ID=MMETSP1065-20121228/2034_1 /TAXON_ID=265537 /ORGANISM="Amphiprora paludosa, Strain CCMP125" /LENGTH=71 /DNA_ID=CAMNT_0013190885 /DNA_START=537 /DNA_END=752 /DNA_ORIENTATION=-